MAIYALNLFNLKDKENYATFSKADEPGFAKHGGRVIAIGNLSSTPVGDIEPRQVLPLVEWESKKSNCRLH